MENIIFLPGLGCDHHLFSHQLDVLKAKYTTKVIICDAKDQMADQIQFVLERSPEKFTLVGHSFGGWIAQWVAIKAPKRVSNLILMGTGTGQLTPALKEIFIEMKEFFERNKASEFFNKINPLLTHDSKLEEIQLSKQEGKNEKKHENRHTTKYKNKQKDKKDDSKLQNLIKKMQSSFSMEKLLNQVNTDLEAKDTSDHLESIQCKTLLIHGKQDPFYEKDMYFLKNKILHCDYIEINDCGHMVPLEQPLAVTSLIETWLDLNRCCLI